MIYELSVTPILGGPRGIDYLLEINSPKTNIPDGEEFARYEDILSVGMTLLKAGLASLVSKACELLERGEAFSVNVALSDIQITTLLDSHDSHDSA
jgi:hypothetical protein